ncbi:MAG: SDR family NAD(P)-dependent oxidoreductase [Thermodesulfobacteriota bacterium]
MASLNGKHVLLTGGSRGVGPVIAKALAERGAHIALAAHSEEGLRSVINSLSKYKVQTLAVPVDLAQATHQNKLISTVLEKFGTIDILVNNAGLETEGAYTGLPWAAIRETIEVNLVAPMALTHLVLSHMLNQKSGPIVNIASTGAKSGAPYAATYCGTKAGLAEWTRGLRLELAGTGVHFSTIFPGYVTDVGMFARFNMTPPWMVGSCTPSQVAEAVIRAIERERLEVIVNSRPARLVFMLSELSSSLGDWMMRKLGAVDFQRRKVGL